MDFLFRNVIFKVCGVLSFDVAQADVSLSPIMEGATGSMSEQKRMLHDLLGSPPPAKQAKLDFKKLSKSSKGVRGSKRAPRVRVRRFEVRRRQESYKLGFEVRRRPKSYKFRTLVAPEQYQKLLPKKPGERHAVCSQ